MMHSLYFIDGELLPSGVVEELYREVSAQTIRNLPAPPTDNSQDGVRYVHEINKDRYHHLPPTHSGMYRNLLVL